MGMGCCKSVKVRTLRHDQRSHIGSPPTIYWRQYMNAIQLYFDALELLAELIGLHPRRTIDEDWAEMLRKAGWRPFVCEYHRR